MAAVGEDFLTFGGGEFPEGVGITIRQEAAIGLSEAGQRNVPVLEVTITHATPQHNHAKGDETVAVYRAQTGDTRVVFDSKDADKDELLVHDGDNVIRLKKSVLDEYRRKTNYHGPVKAALEKSTIVQDGVEKSLVRTKLMQVKFVMKDSSGQELSGPELDAAMAKFPGLIPGCDPSKLDEGKELVTIIFGEKDELGIPKAAIEEYRKLAGVSEPLTAKRERLYKEENGQRTAITVVSLYPDRDTSAIVVDREVVRPKRGRPAGRGRPPGRGRRRVTTEAVEKRSEKETTEPDPPQENITFDLGFDDLVVLQSADNEIKLTGDLVNEQLLLPLQLQSTPQDMEAPMTSHHAWKYLTEYASQCEGVQGLVTQFNNESWLEGKRMSNLFYVDGEALCDISFKAVFRDNNSPITYFLRGFSRLIKSGELNTANDINHLFHQLYTDRKLCLGLKPQTYETQLENNEDLRQYLKNNGQMIQTPFECLYSKQCQGIISVGGNTDSFTFTRGDRTIEGIQAVCSECVTLGKRMRKMTQGRSGQSPLVDWEEQTKQESTSILDQPIKTRTQPLTTRELRRIFSQDVSDILAKNSSKSRFFPEDAEPGDEGRKRRKLGKVCNGESDGVVGVSEEEFMKMVDIRPPNQGVLARSIVKICNVCQFRAPTMLGLFVHMQGHLGSLKAKCDECSVQLNSKDAVNVHKKQVHTQRSPMCTICEIDFTTRDQLFDHMNKHRDHQPFECHMCGHKLTNLDAYKKHIRLTHKITSVTKLQINCKTCNMHFYTRDHMLLHRVNQNHEDVDSFVCKSCKYECKTANDFRSHIWEHTEAEREAANVTICPHCHKVFFSAFKLSYHLEVKHLNQGKDAAKEDESSKPEGTETAKKKKNRGPYLRYLKPNEKYECEKCKRRFKLRETLENHKKYSHGEKTVATKTIDCQCSLCGRKFNSLRRLANHVKIHSGNRPVFQCEECGQIYGKKTQVLEHIRSDHAEQVQRHQQQQQVLEASQQVEEGLVEITEQPHHSTTVESATWSPLKSPFKVSTVEQTQEAVYSLLQLTDF